MIEYLWAVAGVGAIAIFFATIFGKPIDTKESGGDLADTVDQKRQRKRQR